jgi:Leucine-rich repeat (LRR) protein
MPYPFCFHANFKKVTDMVRMQRMVIVFAGVALSLCSITGCPKPHELPATGKPNAVAKKSDSQAPASNTTASSEDVRSAKARLARMGAGAKYVPTEGDLLAEVVIQDGSNLTAEDLVLLGRLADLQKLQVFNCRTLDDEMAAKLAGLSRLTSLALTNSVITDATVELIVKSFPNLTELDLSSNTNMTSGVLKPISGLSKLQRLTLVQNRFNDISAQRLEKLQQLKALDLRGNMEAGDMALEVVAGLPKLSGFKHRSTAVTDSGLEYLSRNQTLDSLLIQDFAISDQSGQHLAKLGKLTQLEIFRCQGFGSEGVLALKGMSLSRLTLRDLPNVDDRAMEVFDDLTKLRRLYLHELTSVGDSGLQHLTALNSLELLDIWTVPQMTDAAVDVIAALPNLKELTIRVTGVTDATVDKLLGMKTLQSLTFKENGSVTADGLKRLSNRKWTKLDIGSSETAEAAAP